MDGMGYGTAGKSFQCRSDGPASGDNAAQQPARILSIYYPIVLFVVGFWLLAESRAYQPGQSWANLTGALMLASLPMFYQFERNPAFTSPYDWGYVDCFVAALAALATALLLVSVRRCSIGLATVGSLAGALTLLVKPVGLLLMPLFYFFWVTEVAEKLLHLERDSFGTLFFRNSGCLL